MNEEPKHFWKKSWTGWRGLFFGWLILMVAWAVIFSIWVISMGTPLAKSGEELRVFGVFAIAITTIFLFASFIRWLFCWRNLKRSLFGLACLATLIALAYAEEDWRGKHDWEKFKHEWEAKGEKFDWQSIVPPVVPDDQNFAMAPIWVDLITANFGTNLAQRLYGEIAVQRGGAELSDRLQMTIGVWGKENNWPAMGNWEKATVTDLKPWQSYYRGLTVKTNEFPIAPQPQTPAEDVLLALSKYDPTIAKLRQAAQRSYSRFPLNYDNENPAEVILPHLSVLKRSDEVLQLRAIVELQNGQSDKAFDDVKLSLRLIDSIHAEPILICQIVRIAMLQITLQPIYEGLVNHQWSDAQLTELDEELAKLNFVADYRVVVRGEMGFQDEFFDYLRRRPEQLSNMSGPGDNNAPPGQIFVHLVPSGWFYQNQLHCARPMVELYLPVADVNQKTISPAKAKRADASVAAQTRRPNAFNIIERLLLPSFGSYSEKFAYAQASLDLARTAIALERYRLAHGNYPDSLDVLAPQFIAKVPHDVIGGQALHYRRTDDGQFVLYSVGWNETDDGGAVVFNKGSSQAVNPGAGDWVWRYPQK